VSLHELPLARRLSLSAAAAPRGSHPGVAAASVGASMLPPAMAYEFKLPDLGEGLAEGEIARWLVSEGQEIAEDDPLVEIQTDKTTVEIPSPAAGRVARILAAEGDVVPVGTVIVVIGDADAAASVQPPEPEPAPEPDPSRAQQQGLIPPGPVRATPLVRRVAQELGVDLATVAGSGTQGRITEEDVRGAAGAAGAAAAPAAERREPVRGIRRRIVEHLTTSHREIPAVTFVEECDFTAADLSLLVPLALQAAAQALREFPELNARLDGGEIVYLERYDIGIAVQTGGGLVVPVVRGCDGRALEELAAEVKRLAEGARSGTLAPEELRGSTFTITSAGKLGGLLVTPLINHPEVGILGVHRIDERPVVRDGAIVVRRVGNVSLTFDHRVVDGARAAEFTLRVIELLQAP
jgi:pyruvate/2-oxoglutarate dehydrogenase complex dihydrolipoamide acyltransferase (E2) component